MPHFHSLAFQTCLVSEAISLPKFVLCRESTVPAETSSAEVPDGDDAFEANTDCFDEIKSAERNTDCFDAVAAQPQQAVSNQVRSRVRSASYQVCHVRQMQTLHSRHMNSHCAAQDESQGAHLGPL
jgi:hypothetical protein